MYAQIESACIKVKKKEERGRKKEKNNQENY